VDAYADTVDLVAQTLGLDHGSVAGHSMGGAIAMTLALRRPAWLQSIVLIGTGARLRVHPLILEGLHPSETSSTKFEATVDIVCQRSYGPTTSDQILRNGRRQLLDVDRDIIYGDYAACNAFDVMDGVGDIALPTLIVSGSADQMTPPKYSQYLNAQISGSQLVEIQDGGHMMALEKPVEVAQAVIRFLGDDVSAR
jgi:pimeloyl-ACP methyl ester carboxylesterase